MGYRSELDERIDRLTADTRENLKDLADALEARIDQAEYSDEYAATVAPIADECRELRRRLRRI